MRLKQSSKLTKTIARGAAVAFVAGLLAFQGWAGCVSPPDLVSWWSFKGSAADRAGLNNGRFITPYALSGGLAGSALGLDGAGGGMEVQDAASLNFGTGVDFSIEAWVRPEQALTTFDLMDIVDKREVVNLADAKGYAFYLEGGRVAVQISDRTSGGVLRTSGMGPDLRDGQWHHVAVTIQRNSTNGGRLYADGQAVLEFDPTSMAGDLSNNSPLLVGIHPAVGGHFKGLIDEVALFRRALSSEEVAGIYTAGAAGKCTEDPQCEELVRDMTAWWRLETDARDTAGTNSGILVNSPLPVQGLVGNALYFTGSQFVELPNSAGLSPTGSFSIEGWILPRQDGPGAILAKWGDEGDQFNQRSYILFVSPGRGLHFAITDFERQWDVSFVELNAPQVVTLNAWNHVAAVFNQPTGTRTLYVNGNKVAERVQEPFFVYNSTATPSIGAARNSSSSANGYFDGLIDELSFYSRSLSPAEIRLIHAAGAAGKCDVAPAIVRQPTNMFAAVGGEILLSVEARPEPLRYEWRKDGLPLAHQTNATLRIINALRAYRGDYDVLLYYPSTTLTSSVASVTVITPVTITSQPSGLELVAGADLLLSTTAEGEGPLTYQWYHNAVPIPDATNGTYAVSSAQPFHTGAYHVTVSNPASSVSSSIAQVVVYALPTVSIEPVSATINEGDDFTFTGVVSGDPTFLRWEKDGLVLPETNTTVNIFAARTTDAGVYTLTVGNLAGSTSASATLAVNKVEPVYVSVFANGTQVAGTNVVSPAPVMVSLTSVFPDGNIYYTLNGAPASFLSTRYTGPFELQGSATLRVRAYDKLFTQSGSAPAVNFVIVPNFTLSITNAGGGMVEAAPLNPTYPSNTVVTLTAVPSNGWTFLGWLGAAAGTNSVTQVFMNADKAVQPVFGAPIGHVITGKGTLEIDPPGPLYPYGTVVRLTAVPDDRNYLAIWGGSASGNANPLYLTVTNAGLEVGGLLAELPANQVALTVLPRGFGTVTVSPTGSVFNAGSIVTLTAVPEPGQAFLGWAGDVATANTNDPTVTVTLEDDQIISGRFSADPVLQAPEPLGGLSPEGFTFVVRGEYGALYQVEASSNLSEWSGLGSISSPFGVSQITETMIGTNQMRFYRAVKP